MPHGSRSAAPSSLRSPSRPPRPTRSLRVAPGVALALTLLTLAGAAVATATDFPDGAAVVSNVDDCFPWAPDVASHPDGGSLVAWQNQTAIERRLLDRDLAAGQERRLLSSGLPVYEPAVAVRADGSAAVAWAVPQQDAIRAVVVDADGSLHAGFFLQPFDGLEVVDLGLTLGEDGESFLAYQRVSLDAVRFDEDGVLEVIDFGDGGDRVSLVEHAGVFWHAWVTHLPTSPPSASVTLHRRSLDGTSLGGLAGSIEFGTITDTALAVDGLGRVWFAWSSPGDGLRVRVFSAEGDPISGPIEVAGGNRSIDHLDFAVDAGGNAIVVWEQYVGGFGFSDLNVWGRRLRASGALGLPFLIADGERDAGSVGFSYQQPAVAVSGPGEATVVASTWRPVIVDPPPCGSEALGAFAVQVPLGEPTDLLLQDGRFRVSVDWVAPGGAVSAANAAPGSDLSGSFWFFQEENKELEVKVLDGSAINGHFWIYASALTDLAFELRIVDQATGDARSYTATAGEVFVLRDVEAFDAP